MINNIMVTKIETNIEDIALLDKSLYEAVRKRLIKELNIEMDIAATKVLGTVFIQDKHETTVRNAANSFGILVVA